jgi:hypothetical protein
MATIGPVTVVCTKRPTEVTTKVFTETRDFTDTITLMRGTPITVIDITTDLTITAIATTLSLGFPFLPTEPRSILDSASDADRAVSGKRGANRDGETGETGGRARRGQMV